MSREDLIRDNETKTDFKPRDLIEADDDFQEDTPTFEAVEEGVSTSLLWVQTPLLLEKLGEVLRQLDFHVTSVQDSRTALYRLRHNPYDSVVLENGPRQPEMLEAFLLPQINLLPMPVRRRFMLCILSETMPTFDRMQAFKAGANLIINVRDVDKAKTILRRGIKEHRSSYRIFWEELERKGQL